MQLASVIVEASTMTCAPIRLDGDERDESVIDKVRVRIDVEQMGIDTECHITDTRQKGACTTLLLRRRRLLKG